MPDDPYAGMTDEQKKAAVEASVRKAVADADTAEADSKKAAADAFRAALPTSDVKPLPGTVTTGENAGLVGQALVYAKLHEGVGVIARAIPEDANVLLVEDRDLFASDWAFTMVSRELKELVTVLNAVKAEITKPPAGRAFAPAIALIGAQAALGGITGILGMFRGNYAITSRPVTLGSHPVVAAIARHLAGRVTIDGFSMLDSSIVERFWEARSTRDEIRKRAAERRATELQSLEETVEDKRKEVANAQSELDKALGVANVDHKPLEDRVKTLVSELEQERKSADALRALFTRADDAVARFDAFASAVTTGDRPPLLAAAERERLHDPDRLYSHVVFVSVEGTGAETHTRQTNFSTSVAFLGGLELSYLVLRTSDNTLVAAGTVPLLAHAKYDIHDGNLEAVKLIQVP
jgi:hypothetical protein